ncbi:unnamed protein product [Phytomonas sp. Hart1]|nr:unnamed protein product [Phytomonas sp. Hart1]|eukprot:CCW67777.1 unnamed protein product [Phytomonas sp. isolate Hart1]
MAGKDALTPRAFTHPRAEGAEFGEIIVAPRSGLRRVSPTTPFKRLLPDWRVLTGRLGWLFSGWQKEFISIAFVEELHNDLRE